MKMYFCPYFFPLLYRHRRTPSFSPFVVICSPYLLCYKNHSLGKQKNYISFPPSATNYYYNYISLTHLVSLSLRYKNTQDS